MSYSPFALREDLQHIDICRPSASLKPVRYQWAEDYYNAQRRIRWHPEELQLGEDMKDFVAMAPEPQNLIVNIFKQFTQADVDVVNNYATMYQPIYRAGEPARMLREIASTEDIHVAAYSLVLETIGLPDSFYEAFLDVEEMRARHDLLTGVTMDSVEDIALGTALISKFGEGLQLFSSFAILLNFSRKGIMKGMGQAVAWSVRDESLHCEALGMVYHTFVEQAGLNRADLRDKIMDKCETVIRLEDAFIERVYEMGDVEGCTKQNMKDYIRYTADQRLVELGYEPVYNIGSHPLPWLPAQIAAQEHANFFESRATEYSDGATTGTWADTWDHFDRQRDKIAALA